MLKNYLKTAIRNLRKHRTHSIINIVGLSVGMAVFILILSYVYFEFSFDRFHSKSDQIYRVVQTRTRQGKVYHQGFTGNLLAEALKDEFPEIHHVTRLGSNEDVDLHYKSDVKIVKKREEYLRVDSSIFNIFDITLVSGDPGTALDDPNSIILTEELARELYSDEDPMGKIITITKANLKREILNNPNKDYVVTGVAKAMPANSHFDFQFLIPYGKEWRDHYVANYVGTYIVLPKSYSPDHLEEKFPMIFEKYFRPEIKEYYGISYDEWVKSGGIFRLKLQPLKDIHLDSKYTGDRIITRKGNKTYVYLFLVIAFFILSLACINFMIMSTARSANRVKEVGIRKIEGAFRGQLIQQFLAESIIISMLALIFSIPLVKLLLPTFTKLVDTQTSIAFSSIGFIVLILVVIALIVGILAGSYPAFYLSSFKPIVVLKGGGQGRARGLTLRNGLIIFQFIISITLILASLVVYNQLFLIRDYDPGYNKENLVVIPNLVTMFLSIDDKDEVDESNRKNWPLYSQTFRQELLKHSHILNATFSTNVPGGGTNWQLECFPEGTNRDEIFQMQWIGADPSFFETYGIKLITGLNYSIFPPPVRYLAPYSPEGVVINETAVEYFGWEEPLGKEFIYKGYGAKFEVDDEGNVDSSGNWIYQDVRTQVIGVIKDYHFQSLHNEIQPLAFYPSGGSNITVKIRSDEISGALEYIEQTWKSFDPDVPFECSFLDDDLDNLYGKEKRLSKIFLYFTILAIVIACLGLFGLVAFTAEQRSKEVGVRKVMGASFRDIIKLLSKSYIILIIIANLVAWPIGYIAMHNWLQNFAYRINIGVGIFLLTGLIALIMVLIAVSSQALRASLTDPVKSLRYE